MNNQEKEIPVKVGDVLKAFVTGFGESGDPIMKVENYIIFLKGIERKGVPVGEMVQIKITKILKKFGFAELTH